MIHHSNRRINVLLAVLGLLACSAARADSWPSFRGTNGRGIGDGDPPIKWDIAKGEHVKWKTRIPGIAHASPIVWDDCVFVTTAVSQVTKAPPLWSRPVAAWVNGMRPNSVVQITSVSSSMPRCRRSRSNVAIGRSTDWAMLGS